MIGAIIGDVCGSRFEFHNHKSKNFNFFDTDCCFTDDTVLTCCIADAVMNSAENGFEDLSEQADRSMHQIGFWYPNCGYGGRFVNWMYGKNPQPYNSCGNGSAMRISPVGDIARSVDEAKKLSYAVTAITHNHPEGLKGAEAAAVANVLLRQGMEKNALKEYIEREYGYDLSKTVDELRNETDGHGKEICQVTIPQAFICFLEGTSFQDVIRNCISIGGDSDTIGAIAGGLAEAYYGVTEEDKRLVMEYLDEYLTSFVIRFENFREKWGEE